jgi:hypothetical protein
MAKMFGEAGNLADFVSNYELDKTKVDQRLKMLEKNHQSLKQHTKDDYEQIINLF